MGIVVLVEDLDLIVLSDEVYEWLVFGGCVFMCFVIVGDMSARIVTIGSASKFLNLTGWRVGWVVGLKCFVDLIKLVYSLMLYIVLNFL